MVGIDTTDSSFQVHVTFHGEIFYRIDHVVAHFDVVDESPIVLQCHVKESKRS